MGIGGQATTGIDVGISKPWNGRDSLSRGTCIQFVAPLIPLRGRFKRGRIRFWVGLPGVSRRLFNVALQCFRLEVSQTIEVFIYHAADVACLEA